MSIAVGTFLKNTFEKLVRQAQFKYFWGVLNANLAACFRIYYAPNDSVLYDHDKLPILQTFWDGHNSPVFLAFLERFMETISFL